MNVNEKIAKLANEHGFNINTGSNCFVKTLDNKIIHNSERLNIPEHDRVKVMYMQPTYQELIEWIFKYEYLYIPAKLMKERVGWLEFWYNNLIIEINNEFVLEGFVGLLINWFEKNDLELQVRKCKNGLDKYNVNIGREYEDDTFVGFYKSKQEARHEGILKCFELLTKFNN